MVYPLTVFILGLGVVGFLLSYVVPKMEKVFSSVNKEIPTSTKILNLFLGIFIKGYGILYCHFIIFDAFWIAFTICKKQPFSFEVG